MLMSCVPEFRKLLDYVEVSLSDVKLVSMKPRGKIALSLMNVALDHAQGICALLEKGIYPPAMALQRVIFETYIRAIWIEKCATDQQVSRFIKSDRIALNAKTDLPFSTLIKDVESAIGTTTLFSEVKENAGKILNSSTHGGMRQVDGYFDGNTIQHTYDRVIVNEMARLSTLFTCMSFSAILDITENPKGEELAEKLFELINPWAFNKSFQPTANSWAD